MKLAPVLILTFIPIFALSDQPVLSVDTNRLISVAKEAIVNSQYKIDPDDLELKKISYELNEALAEDFFISFRNSPKTEVIIDKKNNIKRIRTTFQHPVVEMDKVGNVLRVSCSLRTESKSEIIDKDRPKEIKGSSGKSSTESADTVEVPYVPGFDVLGFKLGESLARSREKTDLLLSSDFDKYQFFNPLHTPQSTVEKVTLAYKKMVNTSNRLYFIQIDYKEGLVDRDLVLKALPDDGEVLKSEVSSTGTYIHKTLHLMNATTEGGEKIPLIITLIERRDGTLYTEYYLKKTFEETLRNK